MANTAEIDYMAILGGFHNLRYLTIWMQPRTALTVISRDAMRRDTYTAANTWLICLVERKEGVRFENIWLRLEIDYNHRGDRNTGSALISYRYDGTLPIQEHIHRLA